MSRRDLLLGALGIPIGGSARLPAPPPPVSVHKQGSAGLPPYRPPRVSTELTWMQHGHGWLPQGALADAMNDDTTFALGRQSAYITSRPDGRPASMTRIGIVPRLDLSGGRFLRILIRVDGGDNLQDCSVYVSSDGLVADYAYAPIQNFTADPSVRWLKDGEWKWVSVSLASATTVGRPAFDAIDSIRIRALSRPGTSTTVRLQAVQTAEPAVPGGIVCFTYDDSYRSQYTFAKAHLDRHRFPGTAFTITSNVQAGDCGDGRYLTTRMLQAVHQESGWEIAPHAYTVTDHARAFACGYDQANRARYGTDALSPAELNLDIGRNIGWLTANGLTGDLVGHCYPQGRFDTGVQRQMAGHVAYARAMTGDSNGVETLPPADPYAIRCYPLDNRSRPATLRTIVDRLATYGGLAVFCCHDIVPVPTRSTQCSIAGHQALVDYTAARAGIRVTTLAEVMRTLLAPASTAGFHVGNIMRKPEVSRPAEALDEAGKTGVISKVVPVGDLGVTSG